MKRILAGILLVASTLASAGTPSGRKIEVMKLPMIGDVKIDSLSVNSTDYSKSKLLINGTLVLKSDSFLSVDAVFVSNRMLVVNENEGGNSCTGKYRVITIFDTGYAITPPVGNCSSPNFFTEDRYLIIMFPENDTERFVKYKIDTNGKLFNM